MRQKDLNGIPNVPNKVVKAISYMGNKRKLATKILNQIYQTVGDFAIFYDLFGGGASMSVASLEAGHKVHYNELNTGVVELLRYIQKGGKLPTHWVTKEEFNQVKAEDDWYAGFVKCVWSFGNNQRDYLFGKEIEDIKRQAHEYLLENGYLKNPTRRITLIKELKEKIKIDGRFELERLQQLERLERLQQLERLERLEITNLSYNQVQIESNSVIYCDPPYKNTKKYQIKNFNYEEFYSWCLNNTNPVFISEYAMPEEFVEVASFEHRSTLSAKANNKVFEKLYWNGETIKL